MTTPLDAHVSVFADVHKTTAVEQLPLGAMLARIQDGTYQPEIDALRALRAQDQAAYKTQKTFLYGFTPGCALHTRAHKVAWKDKLIAPSQIIHLDVDDVDAGALKARLIMEPSVVFAFISPSGEGLKLGIASAGIVDTTTYNQTWRATIEAWKARFPDAQFKEDAHVKFLHALCFVSHDPELYVNAGAVPFLLPPPSSSSAAPPPSSSSFLPGKGGRREGRSLQGGRREGGEEQARVEDALQVIPAEDYDTWLRVGMALHASGEHWARAVWDTWSQRSEKYDADVQDEKWSSFTSTGGVNLATVIHLAQQHGYAPARPSMTIGRQQSPGAPPVPANTTTAAGATPQQWGTTGQQIPQPHANVVTMSDVTEEATQWLWWPYIALGTVCILDGDPGVGKTLLMTQLAASLSLGHPLPDQQGKPTLPSGGPAPTLLLSMEDSLTRTLKPRLVAAGADCTKIHALTSWCDAQGQEQIFTFEHLPFLEEAIEAYHPRLVVIDPVTAYMGKMDIHRANEVQALMGKLTRLAERANCAIVCIRHPAKPGQHIGKAIHRGLGSVGFIGSARTALFAESHPTDSARALLGQTKNNMERHGRTQIFTKEHGRFQWCGVSRISAEMMGGSGRGPDAHAGLEALFWLEYRLAGDLPWPSTDIQEEAEVEGFSKRTLYAASKRLGVIKKQLAGAWTWRLPLLDDITPSLSTIGVTGVTGSTALTALTGASDSVIGEESPHTPDIPLSTPDTPDTPVAPVAPVAPVSAVVSGALPLTADAPSAGAPGMPPALLDVGDWITPLSLDGVIIPAPSGPPPYRIDAIEHDEHAVPFARLDVGTYWPLAQCEPAAPPAQPEQEGVSAREEFKA